MTKVVFSVAGGLALAAWMVGGLAPTAKADPHAVFYTAIGQQQLFFNILAALDQADYVEPASGDNRFSRESLLKQREAAGFEADSNNALNATKTELSGLVTRGVTLEGEDLWTAYQIHQSSLEKARRNYTDELVRVFCERVFGIPGCVDEAKPGNDPSEAFVVSAQDEAAEVAIGVSAALNSGTAGDQELRKLVGDKNNLAAPDYILPFDSAIAAQWLQADTVEEQMALERLNAWTQSSDSADPNLFNNIAFDPQTGRVDLAEGVPSDELFNILSKLADAPTNALASQLSSQAQIMQQQAAEQVNGAKADTKKTVTTGKAPGQVAGVSTANAAPGDGVYYKTIGREITTPASAKIAMMGELAGTLSREVTDLKYVNSEVGDRPGTQHLVDRGGVAGIRSDQDQTGSQGEVAGIFDVLSGLYEGLYEFYDEPKSPVSPNTSAIDPKLESGSRAALLALSDGTFRKDQAADAECGFCVNMTSVWDTVLGGLQAGIAGLCAIWPVLCLFL